MINNKLYKRGSTAGILKYLSDIAGYSKIIGSKSKQLLNHVLHLFNNKELLAKFIPAIHRDKVYPPKLKLLIVSNLIADLRLTPIINHGDNSLAGLIVPRHGRYGGRDILFSDKMLRSLRNPTDPWAHLLKALTKGILRDKFGPYHAMQNMRYLQNAAYKNGPVSSLYFIFKNDPKLKVGSYKTLLNPSLLEIHQKYPLVYGRYFRISNHSPLEWFGKPTYINTPGDNYRYGRALIPSDVLLKPGLWNVKHTVDSMNNLIIGLNLYHISSLDLPLLLNIQSNWDPILNTLR